MVTPASALAGHSLYDSAALRQFCRTVYEVTAKPTFIVAIARKMPRLLEYLGAAGKAPCPLITERALPWLRPGEPAQGPMIFCDDVLNVGTTLSHYVDYAAQRFASAFKIRVYARRESNAELQRASSAMRHDFEIQEVFDADDYWKFETALPQELLTVGKPYDIDFPIIEVPLLGEDATRSEEQWQEFLTGIFQSVHNLTIPTQRRSGISSFTIIEPDSIASELDGAAANAPVRPPAKLRIYISRIDQPVLRVVPMFVVPLHEEALLGAMRQLPPEFRSIFAETTGDIGPGAPFPLEPQYNLATFLLSFTYGLNAVRELRSKLRSSAGAEPRLDSYDLHLIFGPTIGGRLQSALMPFLQSESPYLPLLGSGELDGAGFVPMKRNLIATITEHLRHRAYDGEPAARIFRESLRVLDNLAQGNDPACGHLYPAYTRLRNGLPLCDLWAIIRELSDSNIPLEETSLLLDHFVDIGAVVPVVEVIDGFYMRTYRRGEADPIEFAQFVHQLLCEHSDMLPDSPLRRTSLTKILSAISIYHRDLVPLEPSFGFRGVVAVFPSQNEDAHAEDALRFLARHKYIEFKTPRTPDTQGKLFDS